MGGPVQRILMFVWKGRSWIEKEIYGEALPGGYIVHVVRTSYCRLPKTLRLTCV